MQRAEEALNRLREGNRRFAAAMESGDSYQVQVRREAMASEQTPFAIVVGCADSRVPAELVFDQGIGDLFVVRVAGNVVAPSQVGSVEFAAEQFGTRLVVVMGHTRCGAIAATLDAVQNPSDDAHSRNLRSIVDRVKPAVLSVIGESEDPEVLKASATRANVRMAVDHLRHGSAVLEELIHDHALRVVGAVYSLDSGEVEFLED